MFCEGTLSCSTVLLFYFNLFYFSLRTVCAIVLFVLLVIGPRTKGTRPALILPVAGAHGFLWLW
jgi:hypothetical protein